MGSESGYLKKMELKNCLVLAVIIFTAKGTSADIYQDIGTLVVLQIQSPEWVPVPAGDIKFTHKLLDRANSVLEDMKTIQVPWKGLYEIELSGGYFQNDFNLHLNINGDWKKLYAGGSFLALDLYNFNVGTIMKLNERDLITLNNNQTKGLYVDSLYEF